MNARPCIESMSEKDAIPQRDQVSVDDTLFDAGSNRKKVRHRILHTRHIIDIVSENRT